jgi:hypothetical protein
VTPSDTSTVATAPRELTAIGHTHQCFQRRSEGEQYVAGSGGPIKRTPLWVRINCAVTRSTSRALGSAQRQLHLPVVLPQYEMLPDLFI